MKKVTQPLPGEPASLLEKLDWLDEFIHTGGPAEIRKLREQADAIEQERAKRSINELHPARWKVDGLRAQIPTAATYNNNQAKLMSAQLPNTLGDASAQLQRISSELAAAEAELAKLEQRDQADKDRAKEIETVKIKEVEGRIDTAKIRLAQKRSLILPDPPVEDFTDASSNRSVTEAITLAGKEPRPVA